jgi:1-aminocyclopropane-1-carboxylate deaminase
MVVGFGAQTHKRRVIGIDTAAAVMKIARATAALVGLHRDIRDEEVEIDSRFAGPDYGLPDESTIAAILMAARLEALLTDPVYEGKSMASLIAMARSGEISRGSEVLYVHLGGAPALNAYHKAFA